MSYLTTLAFSLRCSLDLPFGREDRRDVAYVAFLFVAAISLGRSLMLGRIPETGAFGSGLRFYARQPVHLVRYMLFFVVYKTFKEFLSAGDWLRRQQLFFRGLLVAAGMAAIYGTCQFFAQRLGWPLANINELHAVGQRLTAHYLDDLRGSFHTIIATFGETKMYADFLLGVIPILMGVRAAMVRGTSLGSFVPVTRLSHKWLMVLIGTLIAYFALGFSRTGYLAAALLMLLVFLFISRKVAIVTCALALGLSIGASLFMGKPLFRC